MKRALVAGLLIVAATGFAAERDGVVTKARAWRAQHEREIVAELAGLLAIPNIASDAPNIQKNAAAVKALLEKRGLATRLLTLDGAPPIVVGDLAVAG